jgi:tetratricopeptide (TPR) repeat protein
MRWPPLLAPRARGARLLALVSLGLAACGGEGEPARAAAPEPVALMPRDPALAEVRAVLEKGRGALALELLERLPGVEAAVLRARAHALEGDAVAALAALAAARAAAPREPEAWATEVELLASLDRLEGASELLARALRELGPAPALHRARGVLELRTPGHGPQALEALERARGGDPELAFVDYPLAQAHILAGRAALERAPAEATVHARAAQRLLPELLDARELEAEALAGELRFDEALVVYDALAAAGRSYGETPALLEQRAATRALLERDRPGAVAHYLAARRRGLSDEALGFGLTVLNEEHAAALERGTTAAEGGDWSAAEREFARALELVPADLAAENHLAVARFELGRYRPAAEAWEAVLARSRAGAIELPDPVPLNLAKAWRLAGEPERARAVLSTLVDEAPEGPWSDAARELLFVLEAEAQAER